jgi:hypothetical protein
MVKVTGSVLLFRWFPWWCGDDRSGRWLWILLCYSRFCVLSSLLYWSCHVFNCLMRDLHKSRHPRLPQKTVSPKMVTALFSETFESLQISTWCSYGNRTRTLKPSRRNMRSRILHSVNITCLHIELLWSWHNIFNHCPFEINLIFSLFVLVVLSRTSKLSSL